jgi:hypothetical protein
MLYQYSIGIYSGTYLLDCGAAVRSQYVTLATHR